MKVIILNKLKNFKNKLSKLHYENIMVVMISFLYVTISLSSSMLIYTHTENYVVPQKYTICLDAGHGGIDGGAIGSFTKESDINLQITKKLTQYFVAGGFNVINTRLEDVLLCDDESSPSFKLDDMKKRREIIQSTNPDFLISIHCNKFHLTSCVGAQVFYQKNAENSKLFAQKISSYLLDNLPNARSLILEGDYYVLDSTSCPAVLVECGYLSNLEEEKLLASDDYQDKIAYSIYAGTMKYLFSNT
ncbi:MAG: N-acetylmuramoyl-L-alanine amidase [Clostridia bacterium]|nr:N-acetylmuramoyl-L-alanine amidase [Clostridia bacterium]